MWDFWNSFDSGERWTTRNKHIINCDDHGCNVYVGFVCARCTYIPRFETVHAGCRTHNCRKKRWHACYTLHFLHLFLMNSSVISYKHQHHFFLFGKSNSPPLSLREELVPGGYRCCSSVALHCNTRTQQIFQSRISSKLHFKLFFEIISNFISKYF